MFSVCQLSVCSSVCQYVQCVQCVCASVNSVQMCSSMSSVFSVFLLCQCVSVCSNVFQCVQCVCDRSLPLSRLPVTLVAPLRLRQFCQSDKIQGHPSSPNNFQYSPIFIQLKN